LKDHAFVYSLEAETKDQNRFNNGSNGLVAELELLSLSQKQEETT
jgi:hypothetical protein